MNPQFQLVDISSITPYERNSRMHTDDQVEQLAESIDEFGLVGGIVVRNGVIAKGHGTLAAIKLLLQRNKKIYPPPGRKQGATPYADGVVPVLDASGWTEDQFRAYVIADNRIAENASWDWSIVSLEVADLSLGDMDLDVLGFDQKDFALIEKIGAQQQGQEPSGGGSSSPQGREKGDLKIVVDCIDEDHQRELLEAFLSQGLKCRAVM